MLKLMDDFRRRVRDRFATVEEAFERFDRKDRHALTRSDFKRACQQIGISTRLTDDTRRKIRQNISVGAKTIKLEMSVAFCFTLSFCAF